MKSGISVEFRERERSEQCEPANFEGLDRGTDSARLLTLPTARPSFALRTFAATVAAAAVSDLAFFSFEREQCVFIYLNPAGLSEAPPLAVSFDNGLT